MLDQILSSLRVISLPTKTNFRGINLREVALFEGPQGWAEFSPFLEYSDAECAPWLACAIEAANEEKPKLYRSSIAINGTIPALNDKRQIEELVKSFPGVETFKVKVGENLQEDIVRLAWVRSLRPKAKIRVDVNGLWNVETALRNLYSYYENIGPLEYVEQPCATVAELRELKAKIRIPLKIVGDEVLRKATDPFAIDLSDAVDYLMLKVQPLGGIKRAHALALQHKLPIIVSSALESAVGINYGSVLAASFEELSFDCGLGTGSLFSNNVAEIPIVDGKIEIHHIEPNFEGKEVSADRYEWWKNRIMRTAQLLG
ncbi:MAG: o-succinylbenzoate synthase [Actinomycetes bacterium]